MKVNFDASLSSSGVTGLGYNAYDGGGLVLASTTSSPMESLSGGGGGYGHECLQLFERWMRVFREVSYLGKTFACYWF